MVSTRPSANYVAPGKNERTQEEPVQWFSAGQKTISDPWD
jgi:hypothetical protein